MTAALEGGGCSAARPGSTLPPGKTRYPSYRRLGEPHGQSGWAENLIPTRIRSRTVQPVAQSLYRLSYPAHIIIINNNKAISFMLVTQMSSKPDRFAKFGHCKINALHPQSRKENSRYYKQMLYCNIFETITRLVP